MVRATVHQTHRAWEAVLSHPAGQAPLRVFTGQSWSYQNPWEMVSKLDHNLSIPRLCRTDTANSETAEEGDSVLYKGRRKEEREKKKGGGRGKNPVK